MKLEDQVCSLELSKRLKELGVKQESYFYWSNIDTPHPRLVIHFERSERSGDFWISAFTVAELGEMLPYGFEDYKYSSECGLNKYWSCTAPQLNDYAYEQDINEANMRAKMLIHLIENKLISL